MKFFLLPALLFGFLCPQLLEAQKVVFYTPEQLSQPPQYEDCSNSNDGVCTFDKITAYIQKEFNKDLLTDSIPKNEKVMLAKFFIDTSGNAVHPVVLGKNKILNKELARIIISIPPLKPGEKNGKAVITVMNLPVNVFKEPIIDSIYSFSAVDAPPIYEGCETEEDNRKCTLQKIQHFLISNGNFSEIKSTNGQWLKTVVKFTVDERGKVINVTANGINKIMNKEAIRVIKKLHDFTPAIQNGKNVKVSLTLPAMLQVTSH